MSNSPSHPDRPKDQFLEPEILEPEILQPQYPTAGTAPPGNAPATYNSGAGTKKFPWGCVLGGCLTGILLMVGGIVAVGFGSVWFYKQQIAQYTSEQARPLPVVEVSEEELEQLELRVEAFQEQVEKGETPEQLILTANDVNALISKQENLRGKVFVTIDDGLVQAEVSIPTDAIPGAQGRYFNGSVGVDASLEDGVLIVTLQEAEVNGQPVPEAFLQAMRQENLAKDLYKDPEMAKKLRKFESLVIQGDKLILTPKSELPPSETSQETPPSEMPQMESTDPEPEDMPPRPQPRGAQGERVSER